MRLLLPRSTSLWRYVYFVVGTAEDSLDLVGNVSRGGATLVNYFYLADGTKTRALDGSGEGLVYRGPFVYRKGSGSSSLTLESAAFGGGRLTPDGALLYMTDYLGSVRAVIDGATGQIYKAVDYSAYGDESEVMVPQQGSTPEHALAAATLPSGMTLRDSFTGQEDQTPDFGTSYTDFGARQYSPALRRWMTPDPMSEKYYGVSPYAFCNNNPVNFVDPDGRFPDVIWDVASIGMGVKSLIGNIKAGETRAAIGDGIGIVVDVAAAALPFVPGGVGAVRAGAKTVDALDNVAEAAKGVKAAKIADQSGSVHNAESSFINKSSSKGGESADTKLGRQMHKDYNPGDGYIKEFTLPSGKRADAVSFEKGDVRELKPNNSKAIKRGEKQAQSYINELQTLYPDIKWDYHIDVYNK